MSKFQLDHLFSKAPPTDLKTDFSDYACVALILKPNFDSFDLAFIRRAHNPQDAWSGQIAFPGGRKETQDVSDLATAIRETTEEVGWNLCDDHFLGFLSDVRARNKTGLLMFFLRPVVFHIKEDFSQTTIDRQEVDDVFWIPLKYLGDEKNQTTISIPKRGFDLPGVKLPTGDTLWGLTYMITQELMTKLNLTC